MKKLITKLFPKFFGVCNYTYINFEDLPQTDSLELVMVDREAVNTFDKLGIPVDRSEFLTKEVRKAMIDSDCRLDVMHMMQQHIKHINEFYATVLIMEDEVFSKSIPSLSNLLNVINNNIKPEE
jgi:hypothetical protein